MNQNLNYYISLFFKDYLPNLLGVSNNTILSYRDSLVLLLNYLKEVQNININNLKLDTINSDLIEKFLLYLENDRKNSIQTRNQRLSAIHSFFNFLKNKELSYIDIYSQILLIPIKKAPINTISYFSINEIELLLNKPDTTRKYGFRDFILLSFMYECATRVSEAISLTRSQLYFNDNHAYAIIHGKGNKDRRVPITPEFAKILKKYLDTFDINNNDFVFKNKNNKKLTSKGIEYILLKYVNNLQTEHSDKFKEKYSTHSLRHSKAMHLLENGINLIYIRDFLGHASITATEIYAKTNPKIKEEQILKYSKDINIEDKYSDEYKEDLIEYLKTIT